MIDKIFHLADLHIRLFKRHDEYREVFKTVLQHISENKTDNSVIVLAGDIVHSKTEMTPELFSIVQEFFVQCAAILPTIIITGNHDANLRNRSRLDAISPIIDALNNDNLHYWRNSGVYTLGGINWHVFSLLDDPENWPVNVNVNTYNIALYHGPLIGSKTDTGFTIDTGNVGVGTFKHFDLTLLGDIHLRQFMNGEKTIAYPGSLIQQNFGEVLDKGFLEWDVKNKKSTYIPIENEYGYYTFQIVNNELQSINETLPKKIRGRVVHINSDLEEVARIVEELKSKYTFVDLHVSKTNNSLIDIDIIDKRILGDIRDIAYQNNLLETYLKENTLLKDDSISKLIDINTNSNGEVSEELLVRNVIWKMRRFKFSNMFSYGADNEIDFEPFSGIYGIFAANASGKSTLLDSICYCLFDKCSRTYKAGDVLNNQEEEFYCELELELSGDIYLIERHGKKQKNGSVKVNVNFTKNGSESLNGENRNQTNENIRKYFGTYDDFVLTAFASQNDDQSFLNKTQADRKELLHKFLDLSYFEKLHDIAKELHREKKTLLKQHENENYIESIENLEIEEKTLNVELTEVVNSISESRIATDKKIAELQEVEKLIKEIKIINIREVKQNIQEFTNNTTKLEEEIKEYEERIQAGKLLQTNTEEEIASYKFEISKEDCKEEYDEANLQLSTLLNKLRTYEHEIASYQKLIEQLETYEYDPNCKYCVNNKFVKSAYEAKDKLPETIKKLEETKELIEKYKVSREECEIILNQYKEYEEKVAQLEKINSIFELLESKIATNKSKIENNNFLLKESKKLEEEYWKTEAQKLENDKIEKQITEIKSECVELRKETQRLEELEKSFISKISVIENKIKELKEQYDKYLELSSEIELYETYAKAVSRDGIPYFVMTKVLPLIQTEVNSILDNIVDFKIILDTDESNNVFCYITYDGEDKWLAELASGMERFVISTSLRVALINITSLPKADFLALDEGFGVLDANNLQSIYSLFDTLREQFQYVLCISHIDSMKDAADKLITITKEDNYSSVYVDSAA